MTWRSVDFGVPEDHEVKIKNSKKIEKCLNLARELKKTVEYEGDDDTNCSWRARNDPQEPWEETGGTGNRLENWNHSSIVGIG